jgi:hypothetical protein
MHHQWVMIAGTQIVGEGRTMKKSGGGKGGKRLKAKDLSAKSGKNPRGGSIGATINPCFRPTQGGIINPCFKGPKGGIINPCVRPTRKGG